MNKIYSIWLQHINLPEKFKYRLYQYFGSCEGVFCANEAEYRQYGIKDAYIEKLMVAKKNLSNAYSISEMCEKLKIDTISIEENAYPKLLCQLPDPPIVLFTVGNKAWLQKPSLAIVGARKCSEYGFEVARKLAHELANQGLIIVSGMAQGIDEAAHKGALVQGASIAVLGTGVDVCYPLQNKKIYHKLIEEGCLVSEYSPSTQPLPFHFPKRNRIISGLSLGTLVIEAERKSGSLITADLALQQNKEVFAVPGNINSALSKGTNDLIKEGAKLVVETKDILDELPLYIRELLAPLSQNKDLELKVPLDKLEIIVYDCLSWQAIDAYTLENMTKLSIEMMTTVLLKLEMKGLLQKLPGNRYIKLKELSRGGNYGK